MRHAALVGSIVLLLAGSARAADPNDRLAQDQAFGLELHGSAFSDTTDAGEERDELAAGLVFHAEGSLAALFMSRRDSTYFLDWWTVELGVGGATDSPHLWLGWRFEPALRVVVPVNPDLELFGMAGLFSYGEYAGLGARGAFGGKLTAGGRLGRLYGDAYVARMIGERYGFGVTGAIVRDRGLTYRRYIGLRLEYIPVGDSDEEEGEILVARLVWEIH